MSARRQGREGLLRRAHPWPARGVLLSHGLTRQDGVMGRAPRHDVDDHGLEVEAPKESAAGVPAVAIAMKLAVEQMGVRRTAQTLLRLNQADGFDCQGCAWPDPDPSHRHTAEFCENGAKAVTEEATLRRVDRSFFETNSLVDLEDRTD